VALAAFHVLEHLGDPAAFLFEASQFLAPHGVIVASVPNPNRAVAKVLSESWDMPPHHLTRFSRPGLVRLFERVGFDAKKLKDQPRDVSPRELASLMAEASLNDRAFLARGGRGRWFLKPLVALIALPRALGACVAGCGTALYIVAARRD
jgi:hypothetical protein